MGKAVSFAKWLKVIVLKSDSITEESKDKVFIVPDMEDDIFFESSSFGSRLKRVPTPHPAKFQKSGH
ncbi:hypothetical protein BO71DRAFT_395688 [Aspergillus ellipticus CBS 707.79]|uniref:Uncharacterized protein n=1 Tax=Aspergillus ellipticus CBS 707.79 TaxID=1448320 RepID=A0A319EB98_9EURO|nr:hypothetical protein BO71DRAFT_395688 [Aspergillus ellipticus CBS 707.79]